MTVSWSATMSLEGSSQLRLEVRRGAQRLLRARLPYPPAHGLALRSVLEGLSFWQGAKLYAVHDVGGGGTDLCAMDRVDELYVPRSPLVDVVVRPGVRRRGEP